MVASPIMQTAADLPRPWRPWQCYSFDRLCPNALHLSEVRNYQCLPFYGTYGETPNITMSFGFGIGDIIASVELAKKMEET
jgi:hypothetical protein